VRPSPVRLPTRRDPHCRARTLAYSWLLNQHIETVHASFLNAVGLSADEFQACLVKFGDGKHLVERIIASEQRLNETRQKILGQ
jgi:hypothetical protein